MPRLPGDMPLGYHLLGLTVAGTAATIDHAGGCAACLSFAGGAATRRAQLGADDAAL